MRRRLGPLLVTAALAFAAPAHADPHTDSLAAFERGKALRDQGKYVEAAKEFKEAVEKEKSVGGYYNLGLCLDRLGKYPEALKAYRQSVAIAQEKGDPRSKEALDAVQAVRNRTHWIIVNVRDDIAQTPGLHVEVDGREVRPEDYGVELMSQSSEHALRVSAKDYGDLVIHPPDRQPFTVDKLGKSLIAPPETIPGAAAPEGPQPWGAGKWAGVALVAGGIVAGIVGFTFTSDFYDQRDQIQVKYKANSCPKTIPGSNQPDPTCAGLENDFNTNRDDATIKQAIAYGGGGLLLVGGAFLFFFSSGDLGTPFGLRVVPDAGIGHAGLNLSGRF